MKNLVKILSAIMIIVFVNSCNEGPANPEDFKAQLVVDAYLLAGQPLDSLILRTTESINKPLNLDNGISGAVVTVASGDSTFSLSERSGKPGYYYIPSNEFRAKAGETYQLEVEAGEYQAAALTTVPGPFEITFVSADTIEYAQVPLNVQWTESEGAYGYIVRVTSLDTTAQIIERRFRDEEEEAPERSGYGVVDQNFADMPWFGFSYYGLHELAVFAADRNFYEFAKTARQSSATLEQPIYNIEGALGIFGSAQVRFLQVVVVPSQQ